MRSGLRVVALGCLAAAAVLAAPAAALAAGSISGTVTAAAGGAPVAEVEVCAEVSGGSEDFECTETDGDGEYALAALAPGSYRVEFLPPSSTNLVFEYFDGKTLASQANPVTVVDGVDTPNVDATLDLGGSIAGRVGDEATGLPIEGAIVCARVVGGESTAGCGVSGAAGDYVVGPLRAGTYKLYSLGPEESGYLFQYYSGKPSLETGDPIGVSAGAATPSVNFGLYKGGVVLGTVTDALSGAGVRTSTVCAREAPGGKTYDCTQTSGSGGYALTGLAPGSYKIWFSPDLPEEEDGYFEQYFDSVPTFAQATALNVSGSSTTAGVDARLLSRKALPASASTKPVLTSAVLPLSPPKPRRVCPKQKRLVKVKGKKRCVKRHSRRHQRHRR